MINELKLNEAEIAFVIDKVLKENADSNNLINALAIALSGLTNYSVDKISYGLKNLSRQFGFKEKLIKKLGY